MKKSTRRNIFEIRRKELYCYGMIHKQKNIQFLKKLLHLYTWNTNKSCYVFMAYVHQYESFNGYLY